ncbi:hypothetical protein DFS34DRAFT_590844 [Phlyctochytrium arcticum]|nr:hypothetical protein DFS34DRAFT_590844 [Phlyctochytrium arcticum]
MSLPAQMLEGTVKVVSEGTEYALHAATKGDQWFLTLVGQKSVFQLEQSRLAAHKLVQSRNVNNTLSAWRRSDILVSCNDSANVAKPTSAQVVLDPMGKDPLEFELLALTASQSFQYFREYMLETTSPLNASAAIKIRELEAQVQELKNENERLRGTPSAASSLPHHNSMDPMPATTAIKRPAPAARSLINPRVRMKVARGAILGDPSPTSSEE